MIVSKKRNGSFFANTGEAIVFWISSASVVALLALAIFRAVDFDSAQITVQALQENHQKILTDIDKLKKENRIRQRENQLFARQLDSLRYQIQLHKPGRKSTKTKRTPLDQNRNLFLNKSN